MDPVERKRRFEHRRARLAELLRALEPAPRAWFATAIRRSESYVARSLLPEDDPHRKNIGDAIMNAATTALDLDPGWFDLPLGSTIPQGVTLDEKGRVHRDFEAQHIKPAAPADPTRERLPPLSPEEHRLLEAFHLIPDDEQADLLRELEQRAERYRRFAERLMRQRESDPTDDPPPANVGAPHFPSTRSQLVQPPGKRAPAAGTSGPSGRPSGKKTGRRE